MKVHRRPAMNGAAACGAILILASVAGEARAQAATPAAPRAPGHAENRVQHPASAQAQRTEPAEPIGLQIGQQAPDATLADPTGASVSLADELKKGPAVIVFYRGGWCPYCNKHLHQWSMHLDELARAGARLIAISPEKPDESAKTIEKDGLKFTVLSDTSMEAAKGFKLVFEMDPQTQKKYKGYGIDLSKHNASATWQLPHPATFVIDASGVVRYASVDTDYTKRADPKDALAAVRALSTKPAGEK